MRNETAAKSKLAIMPALWRRLNQFWLSQLSMAQPLYHPTWSPGKSDRVRDVLLRAHQGSARDEHDLFVRPAARGGREMPDGFVRDGDPDDGEVAGIEFENIRAVRQRHGLHPICVRVGAKSTFEHRTIFHLLSGPSMFVFKPDAEPEPTRSDFTLRVPNSAQ